MRSESTRAFGQPRLTNPTFGVRSDIGTTDANRSGRFGSLIRRRFGGDFGMRGVPCRRLLHGSQSEEHRERDERQEQPRPHGRASLGSAGGGGKGGVGRHGGESL